MNKIELKIKSLKLENFGKFDHFECVFGKEVTRLVGINGSGKTTVGLTGVWATIKGIAERASTGQLVGERFRFIGRNRATSDLEINLVDEKNGLEIVIKNHLSKQSNQIEFDCIKGALPDDWVHDFLNIAFLSAKNFTQLSGKEQALLLGIDVDKFDVKLAELKQDFTIINSALRGYGDLVEVEKVESVSVIDLMQEKEIAEEFNLQQGKTRAEKEQNVIAIKNIESDISLLQDKLKECKSKKFAPIEELKDIEEIREKLKNAADINRQVLDYENYCIKHKEKVGKEIEAKKNKDKQSKIINERIDFIKSFKFGFKGLGVDDKGGLILNEKPIKEPYFSKGELELIVAKLYTSLNPIFKTRFIDDFELLDEDNQKKILDTLLKKGFQVITAEVGKVAKDKKNSILLRECKAVDDYDDNKEELL
ncbi:hypothetical protein LCGC14_0364570 [marine sediment metagenome]|uniref:Uncharacterized protein n=1 Tax=marine sediment metagenome TaxID=412755 RepID=A0A0F9T6X1_9ZZZZ